MGLPLHVSAFLLCRHNLLIDQVWLFHICSSNYSLLLVSLQMKFMMYAFGGPNEYQGRDMYSAHNNMHLTDEHFNVIVEHFGSTLDELNVPKEVQEEVVQVVLGTKKDIVGH